jgi:hypothetical protein
MRQIRKGRMVRVIAALDAAVASKAEQVQQQTQAACPCQKNPNARPMAA